MYLGGCLKTLGCTIVIRGECMEILQQIKEILDFMVFVVYSLKLETCLFRDQFSLISPAILSDSFSSFHSYELNLTAPNSSNSNANSNNTNTSKNEITVQSQLQSLVESYSNTILSCSPHIQFPAPYLVLRKLKEEKLGGNSQKKILSDESKQVLHENYKFPTHATEDDGEIIVSSAIEPSRPLLSTIEKNRADIEYLVDKANKFLNPFVHQNIVVLYSIVCKKAHEPCLASELQLIEYYSDSDLTLGQFIEDLCLNHQSHCLAKGCEIPLGQHCKVYTHGSGRILFTLTEMNCKTKGMEDVILMWSQCKVCHASTPTVPISEESWKYSFGKYLELSFYQPHLVCRADLCPHTISQCHLRFFGWKNLLVTIEYFPIDLFEVSVPSMRLECKSELFIKARQSDANEIRQHITAYFDSILERIKHFSFDILSASKVQICKDIMSEMNKRCNMEKKYLLQYLQQTCVSTDPTDSISLNAVTIALLDKVTAWDNEFNTFVRQHVHPDSRDIRRMTTSQIKRMFVDKDLSDTKSISSSTNVGNEPVASLDVEMDVQDSCHVLDPFTLQLGSSPTTELSLKPSLLDNSVYHCHSREVDHSSSNSNGLVLLPLLGSSPTLPRTDPLHSLQIIKTEKVENIKSIQKMESHTLEEEEKEEEITLSIMKSNESFPECILFYLKEILLFIFSRFN